MKIVFFDDQDRVTGSMTVADALDQDGLLSNQDAVQLTTAFLAQYGRLVRHQRRQYRTGEVLFEDKR